MLIAFLCACDALSRKAKARTSLMQMEPRCRLQFAGSSSPSSLVFLNTTERKRPLRPTPHTCGLPCGLGVWWFWPRKHHQLVSYLLRILSDLRGHGLCLMNGAGDMACADVATAKAKVATAINLIIRFLRLASGPIMPCLRGQTLDIARGLATGAYRVEHVLLSDALRQIAPMIAREGSIRVQNSLNPPYQGGGQADGGQVVSRQFIVAGGNASEVL